jgi:hypothetical protein
LVRRNHNSGHIASEWTLSKRLVQAHPHLNWHKQRLAKQLASFRCCAHGRAAGGTCPGRCFKSMPRLRPADQIVHPAHFAHCNRCSTARSRRRAVGCIKPVHILCADNAVSSVFVSARTPTIDANNNCVVQCTGCINRNSHHKKSRTSEQQSGQRWGVPMQNSLPSGSARVVHCIPYSSLSWMCVAPSAVTRATSAVTSSASRSRCTRFFTALPSGT